MVKTIKGREVIWEGLTESCLIKDKSFESLTRELNLMFRTYKIDKCIQKITFLAQVNAETGFFSLSHEERSKYLSSQSIYKGRGLIQLTGGLSDDKTSYNKPGPYLDYGKYISKGNKFEKEPDLIAEDLHYTVDSAGWEWSVEKKVPNWNPNKYTNQTIKEAVKWKVERFPKALGLSLNKLALVIEETGEEKYFWLQSKMLNGYTLTHKDTPDPNGWSKRKEGLQKVKDWFKYDKEVCKGEKELVLSEGEWHDPVDNPQITMYMQSNGYWPKYAAFGYTRKQTRKPHGQHQGLDIFALDDGKTNVYACLSGKVVYASTAGSYGKLVVLEVSDTEQLKIFKSRKRDYTLRYKDEGEEAQGAGFSENSTKIYFRYSHLSKILVSINDEVTVGKVIAISGTSGIPNGGTCGPHVHFEIASSLSGAMIENRVNPGYYVYYKNESEMTVEEKKIQETRKNQGKK